MPFGTALVLTGSRAHRAEASLEVVLIAQNAAAIIDLPIGTLALLPSLTPAGPVGAVILEEVGVAHPLSRKTLFLLVRRGATIAIAGDIGRFIR